ncbi:MAG: TolC family protein [Gemmatimonadota bacterium]
MTRGICLLVLLIVAAPAAAQDTLTLEVLRRDAVAHDARWRQLGLQERAARLRLGNIAAGRLPALSMLGEVTHQSEVASIPITLPGVDMPIPPKDRYAVTLDIEQLLYDGGVLDARRTGEEAALETELARVAALLHPLRAEVNEAYFDVLLLDSRRAEIASLMAELEARLTLLRIQVAEGAALPGDTAAVLAELLRAGQQRNEAEAGRRAALAVLSDLTGRQIDDADVLVVPSADEALPADPATAAQSHPQFAVFDARRRQLELQSSVIAAGTLPRVHAFGRFGYGRPGLQQFAHELHDYWIGGVTVRWRPWSWGVTQREQELLRVEQQRVELEAEAFTAQLVRRTRSAAEQMSRLRSDLGIDEQIVALREQVERQAAAQLEERAITYPEYIDARTDLQDARIALHRHRIELARLRAHYLTTLGRAP